MITLPPELAAFAAGVKQRTLPNGLTALVVPRRGSATVHFAIAFGVGAVDEPEGRSGIAHLYEHMAFKGTPRIGTRNWPRERALLARLDALDEALALERARHAPDARKLARLKKTFDRTEAQAEKLVVPNELDELYQRNGAKGLNAYTSKDATVYIVNLPANRMALWAAIEGERVRTPVLRQFYRERNVVIEELRRYDDMPQWRLYEKLPLLAYSAHPYRTPIIGWLSDLERMTRRDLEQFFRSRYRPDRAVAAVVGAVDPAAAFRLIERTFGSWRAGSPAPRPLSTVEPEQRGERRAVERMAANSQVGMAWPIPTWGHTHNVALHPLAVVLGKGDSSRLHSALVKGKQCAVSVFAYPDYPGERYARLFIVGAVPRAPHGPEECERAIDEEIGRLVRDGVAPRELEKASNLMEADVFKRLTDNSSLASDLAHTHAVTGDWRRPLELVAELRALTPDDLKRVAKTYLVPARRSVVTIENSAPAGTTP